MRRYFRYLPGVVLALVMATAADAQVEQVAAKARGSLWGSCAVNIQTALQRLDGVASVQINQRAKVIFISYNAGAKFDPYIIRDTCAEEDIGVVMFQVVAKGQILEEGSEHYFVAGEDRFKLIAVPEDSVDGTLEVIGTVDDQETPYKMKIIQSKPVEL